MARLASSKVDEMWALLDRMTYAKPSAWKGQGIDFVHPLQSRSPATRRPSLRHRAGETGWNTGVDHKMIDTAGRSHRQWTRLS